jgi:hypothetical protein
MGRIVPDGFLTISDAVDELVVGMYSGVPDRPTVKELKERGYDAGDGEARNAAYEKLWESVDREKIESFLVGPKQQIPFKIPADMTWEIPLLRSPRGGDFTFLRPSKGRVHKQLTEWFGQDLSQVSVVFRQRRIERLARTRLQARRRKTATIKTRNIGRPPLQEGVKKLIREVVDKDRWSPQQSKKALTVHVNRLRPEREQVSQSTVSRALGDLYAETKDRRFQCLSRKGRFS